MNGIQDISKHWGAEFISNDVVRFRVWAEGQKELTLRLAENDLPMTAVGSGWFQIDVPGVTHGTEYQYVLPDGMAVPDPASRARAGDVNVLGCYRCQTVSARQPGVGRASVGRHGDLRAAHRHLYPGGHLPGRH